MKHRIPWIPALIALAALAVLAAILLLPPSSPPPLTSSPTPSTAGNTTPTPQATPPPQWTPTAETPTPLPTPTPDPTFEALLATAAAAAGEVYPPPTLTPQPPTPTPLPTMTAEEQALVVELQDASPQTAASVDECSDILKTEPWCSVVWYARRITRPEWEELLPQTEFFLVKTDLYGGELMRQRNWLIVEQDGQRYTPDTFDRLLAANGITEITDENRELVAKAFALMTVGDYLEDEVVFTEWKEGEWQGEYTYDHYLKAWTKIQGLEIWWWFVFEGNRLRIVTRGGIAKYHLGSYIDVPFETLPLPPLKDYYFTGG